MSIAIDERKPSEALNSFVELFWRGDFNFHSEGLLSQNVVPNGYVELIIHLSDDHCDLIYGEKWHQSPPFTIIGPYTKLYTVQFSSHVQVFGIRFKPEAIYNIFGVPASEFMNAYENMADVIGNEFLDFCSRIKEAKDYNRQIRLAEQFLLKQIEKRKADISYINRAAEIIRQSDGFLRIEELSDQVYISLRQLEREFKSKIGFSPKLYMKIARLNAVHRNLESQKKLDFTAISYACGYADQAHFIRDFKNFTGVKPSIFIKDRQQYIVNP